MINTICPLASVEEVFKTGTGAIYQCSRKNCYWMEFAGSTTSFSVSDFLKFKKYIDQINIEKMLIDTARSSDFTLVMPYRTERCFLLSVQDILNLRELLDGAKFMIELNSVIKACLRSSLVAVSV
ncbi:hypothetical protein SF1_16320 [Sphingobacterium faecium NBRC 15299]|jgi:hypothetical protein|uniref:DUF6686 family protein n=1 Tax=Sphingobacterium faecium TaxID=34087 RepID=UPI000D3CB778|nr:DUF6686 family protein [Sphingobacterium faecium]PTX09739.1 hypothetical protein C8N37_106370 [Sphingobacterium faecium]GEM63650.1 hypothetical protein SF1_16320 [Sphingobacterium faecium NBRC 15299]